MPHSLCDERVMVMMMMIRVWGILFFKRSAIYSWVGKAKWCGRSEVNREQADVGGRR